MSQISFIRRKGDNQIYADIQDDASRNAWYQPVSPETLQALGITDKNIRYAGKIDQNLIQNKPLDQAGLQQVAQGIISNGGYVSGIEATGNIAKLANGTIKPVDFGTHDVNFDPTTPEQDKQNLSFRRTGNRALLTCQLFAS